MQREANVLKNQVASVTLLSEGQDINFSKDVKSIADEYTVG